MACATLEPSNEVDDLDVQNRNVAYIVEIVRVRGVKGSSSRPCYTFFLPKKWRHWRSMFWTTQEV